MKRFVFCCFLFLCFQQAKALYFPSDSLKLKPKKFSHFVGIGNKTGGHFMHDDQDYPPKLYRIKYELTNLFNANYLFQVQNKSRTFFSLENKLEIKRAKSTFLYSHIYDKVNDSITGIENYQYVTINLIPSINFNLIKRNKYIDFLSIGINYQVCYFITKANFTAKHPPKNKGISMPFLNFKLANNFFVKLKKKTIGIEVYAEFSFRAYEQLFLGAQYSTKDFITDFDYEINGNIQRVLYKTLGFNLYYQL